MEYLERFFSLYFAASLGLSFIALLLFSVMIDIGGSSYLLLRYTKGRDQREVMRVVKFIIFVIFAQLILINIIKPLAARPRMRMLEVTPQAHFQNWWEFGTAQKNPAYGNAWHSQ